MKFMRRSQGVLGAALVVYALASAYAAEPERSPTAYHILGRTSLSLKDYRLTSKGCNIGVNDCGGQTTCPGFMADDTQLVADQCVEGGGDVYQAFCNIGGCPPRVPPVETWTCPILADQSDATFIAACNMLPGGNFPAVFTSTDWKVTAPKDGGDCVVQCVGGNCPLPQPADSDPGNGKCDLPPGDYGQVTALNDSIISFDGGVYNLLSYQNGKSVIMEFKAQTTLNVSQDTEMRFNDGARVVAECGDLRINFEGGRTKAEDLVLGKNSIITADICVPYGRIRLGNSNSLTGHFFGKTVNSDFGNDGRCCLGNCGCFDVFTPNPVCQGASLDITGGCDLNNISEIKICGVVAPIVSRSAEKITVTVPNVGAPQSCTVVGKSATGTFTGNLNLQVELCGGGPE